MDSDDRKLERDFAHTLMVLTARALAEHEAKRAPERRFLPRYEIALLAAASGEAMALPKTEVSAEGGDLGLTIEAREDGLRVTVQLYGFAALHAHGGHEARLVSASGVIDYAFRFSRKGTGVCVLADTPQVRAGLANCTVLVADA